MERYKVFLGSEIAKTYDEAKNFTLARVDEYTEFNHKELFSTLAPIDNFTGNVFSLIHLKYSYVYLFLTYLHLFSQIKL